VERPENEAGAIDEKQMHGDSADLVGGHLSGSSLEGKG
jgi:hypothetical protein